ncbi:hypothetical protein [Sphingomonas desiccabilis]|uniref:Uncharacterized protein n=1 Tax=Sphingomonas desiccabilis TaxID=429134 RepID=A0A4Q2IZM6_9SPHN|nr:hypothetical protein [Sphingomonas desiccabilis]MBB3910154.1 hypothetical protein [Sphingomonas desiccabilis]RXZ34833.1 hypothetical protein EO081_04015 [Sphingomonas desiccabilis]
MGAPLPAPSHQLKVPVVRRSVYTLYLEQATPQHTFIHCDVHHPWSGRVKRQLAADFEALKALHGGPLYALHERGDTKHSKFLAMFGFRWAASFVDHHHRHMEVHQT